MQNITQSEFDREVEALKSHRRISVNRPLVDPDLPEIAAAHGSSRELYLSDDGLLNSPSPTNHSSPTKPWNLPSGVSLSDDGPSANDNLANNGPSAGRSTFSARRRGLDQASSNAGNEEPNDQLSDTSKKSNGRLNDDDAASNRPLDPTHLFWVPASMHPEISPSDFRKFLHDHASRAVREQQEMQNDALTSVAAQTPKASESAAAHPVEALKKRSTSIARRGSTLRRQYKPETDDDSPATSSASSPSSLGSRRAVRTSSQSRQERAGVPHLSIDDLQKLERLAEEASKSSDPSELRSVLRRTMSLNVSPSALDQVDAVPLENEQDAPLIVPRPGQILRRAARTKIRKSSFSTDGSSGGGTTPGGSRRRRGQTGSFASSGGFASVSGEGFDSESGSINESGSEEQAHLRQTRLSESNVDNFSRQSFASDDTQRTSITSTESLTSASSSREALNEPDALVTPTQQSISGRTLGATGGYFDIHKGNDSDDEVAIVTSPTSHYPSADSAAGRQDLRDGTEAAGPGRVVAGDDSGTAQGSSTIKPIAVQRVSPVPAFERTRPAPQPPTGSDEVPIPLAPEPGRPRDAQSVPAKVPSPSDVFSSTHQVARSDTMPNLAGPSLPSKPAKEKKGAFGLQWLSSWTKDDDSTEKLRKKEKKERKERERERERESSEQGYTGAGGYTSTSQGMEKEREKDSSSFLGSLFGKRKGNEEAARQDYGSHLYGAATGMSNITAGSLLDMHGKGGMGLAYYNRYPIHIERAVYRLSHIKLANPRRPLYEQVLISNLMFWYLSVINQSQQQQQQQQQQQHQAQQRQGQPLPQQHLQQPQPSPQQSLPEQHPQISQEFGQQTIDTSERGSGGVPGEVLSASSLAARPASESAAQQGGIESDSESPPGIDPSFSTSSAASAGLKGQLTDAGIPSQPSSGAYASIADPAVEQVNYDNDRYPGHPTTAVDQISGGPEAAPRSEGQEKVNGYPVNTPVAAAPHVSAQQPHWQQPQPVQSPTGRGPVSNPQKARRSGLVKPNRAPPGTRSAEMAIPAAGYGAQHRQLNSEMAHSGQSPTSSYSGDYGGSNAERSNRLSPNLGPNRMTGRSVSPSNSISAAEHTWIGSNQRRSPGAEERKSDPIPLEASSRTGGVRSGSGGGGGSGVSGYQRASDPTAGVSMSNGHGALEDEHRSSAPLPTMENTSAHLTNLIDEQIVESKGWSRVPMRDGAEPARTEAPLPSLHPTEGVIPLQAEANAMLGAARKSQSRRR